MNKISGIPVLVVLFLLYNWVHIYLVQFMFKFVTWCTNHVLYCYLYDIPYMTFLVWLYLLSYRSHPFYINNNFRSWLRAKAQVKVLWMFLSELHEESHLVKFIYICHLWIVSCLYIETLIMICMLCICVGPAS